MHSQKWWVSGEEPAHGRSPAGGISVHLLALDRVDRSEAAGRRLIVVIRTAIDYFLSKELSELAGTDA